ncbi:MFS transporter [Amycolatopsis sp. DG1A-15b]|uniref:MFS transporter n=1 Tax=Amycolatopsis sp. DG1A-15b TaxID=3052846 RepID=UPI00255BB7CC|nr:MFS transporter [Amycolatopsis sp. DG1A-15b]WIX91750.1 MFS transporter [Amycolatopsis sp. DG1A-15b]
MTENTAAPPAAAAAPAFVWTNRIRIALAILCVGHILETVDITIVNVALPRIKVDLGFADADLSWVVNAYTVAFGGFLLLAGRAGDLLGRRRVFLGGLAVFTLASLVAGLSQNAIELVVMRAVQGLAAAFIGPMTLAMLAATFPEGAPRNKAIGLWGMLSGVSASAGLLIGGLFVNGPGWQWIFLLNIPLGLALIVASFKYLDVDKATRRFHRFDGVGAITATGGLTLLAYGIVETTKDGWDSPRTFVALGGAVVLIGYFLIHEAFVAKEPLLSISLLRVRSVFSANVVQALVNSGMFVMFYLATLYQQEVLHFTPLQTGFAYVPLTLLLVVFARLAPVLIPKLGVRYIVFGAALIAAGGLALFARVSPDGTFLGDILAPSLLLSIGVALTFIPATIAAVSGVPAGQTGVASGLVNVSRTIGGALGLAVVSTLATARTTDLLSSGTPKAEALTSGFRLGFAISAALLVVAAFTALALFPNVKKGGAKRH